MFSGSSEEARIDESLTALNINFLSSPSPPTSQHQTGHSHSYQGEAVWPDPGNLSVIPVMMQSLPSEILIPKNTV